MSKKLKLYRPELKAKVTLPAKNNEDTTVELANRFEVLSTMITIWKKTLLEGAADLFEPGDHIGNSFIVPLKIKGE